MGAKYIIIKRKIRRNGESMDLPKAKGEETDARLENHDTRCGSFSLAQGNSLPFQTWEFQGNLRGALLLREIFATWSGVHDGCRKMETLVVADFESEKETPNPPLWRMERKEERIKWKQRKRRRKI